MHRVLSRKVPAALLGAAATLLLSPVEVAAEAVQGAFTVKLKRQQIPLHSAGGIVHHKSAYYGEVFVGGPVAQPFQVVFDTGSGHLVLPSAMCRSDTCRQHRRYRRRSSQLAQDIDVDGTPVDPWQARDQITVSFGTGEVTGIFVRDRVCLGPPQPPQEPAGAPARLGGRGGGMAAAALLQVDKARLRETNGTMLTEDAPGGTAPRADFLASAAGGNGSAASATAAPAPAQGAAPAGADAAGAAAVPPVPGRQRRGCVELRLIAATDMTEDPFSSFAFDGVLGLGLQSLSQTKEFNFLEAAAPSGAWSGAAPGAERTFAVFLAVSEEEESEITFGGWRQERARGGAEPAWCHVRDPQEGYWQLDIYSIVANGHKLDFCGEGLGCRAVVDTGTSLLGVPSALGPELVDLLRHTSTSETGACDGPGPRLEIDLGNFTVVLDPADYARPELLTEDLEEVQHPDGAVPGAASSVAASGNRECVPMLMHIDLPSPLSPRTLILGEPVLQRFYTIFDGAVPRVGFAEAAHAVPRTPLRILA